MGDLLFGVDRSPSVTQGNNTLLNELRSITENKQCITVGDFNYTYIDLEISPAGAKGLQFHECVRDFFLYQHVDALTLRNILELILSTEQHMVNDD